MRAAGGGEIINTSSEATIESFAMLSMYAVTKAGLEALGQALRTEYEKEGDTRHHSDPGRGRR